MPQVDLALVRDDVCYCPTWSKYTKEIMSALGRGPIRVIRGVVCDARLKPLQGVTAVNIQIATAEAAPWLQANRAAVKYADEGGRPTWNLVAR